MLDDTPVRYGAVTLALHRVMAALLALIGMLARAGHLALHALMLVVPALAVLRMIGRRA